MEVVHSAIYLGPNLYTKLPVIHLRIDAGGLEGWPNAEMRDRFLDRLFTETAPLAKSDSWLRGKFEDTADLQLVQVVPALAVALLRSIGADVSFGEPRSGEAPGLFEVVYEYEDPEAGVAAGILALSLCQRIAPASLVDPQSRDPEFSFAEAYGRFRRFAAFEATEPHQAMILKEAKARHLPWFLYHRHGLQLGQGRCQRRVIGWDLGVNEAESVARARDKSTTNAVLCDAGLPAPRQIKVDNEQQAVSAARSIGYPVAVKPAASMFSRGVSLHLTSPSQVREAFQEARSHGSIVVESMVVGRDYRVLVVGKRAVAAARRLPPQVVGDGVRTIEALVADTNRDPSRGERNSTARTRIELDQSAIKVLGRHGWTMESVLPAGQVVDVKPTGALAAGGNTVDMTAEIHPDNADLAVRAVAALGLEIGGVDLLMPDIGQSYKETGGAVCEVNARPGLRSHMNDDGAIPQHIVGSIMDLLYPPDVPARIPIAAISGGEGTTNIARMVSHICGLSGLLVGSAHSHGGFIGDECLFDGEQTGARAAQEILGDERVELAVFEESPESLLQSGLGYDHCMVGAVAKISSNRLAEEHSDQFHVANSPERIVVANATGTVVLNADDEQCRRLAAHSGAKSICYVALKPENQLISDHTSRDGDAVVLESEPAAMAVVLYQGGRRIPLVALDAIPPTISDHVEDATFAAATALGLGIDVNTIRRGLTSVPAYPDSAKDGLANPDP